MQKIMHTEYIDDEKTASRNGVGNWNSSSHTKCQILELGRN